MRTRINLHFSKMTFWVVLTGRGTITLTRYPLSSGGVVVRNS